MIFYAKHILFDKIKNKSDIRLLYDYGNITYSNNDMNPDPASRPRFFMTKVLNNLHFKELLMETAI